MFKHCHTEYKFTHTLEMTFRACFKIFIARQRGRLEAEVLTAPLTMNKLYPFRMTNVIIIFVSLLLSYLTSSFKPRDTLKTDEMTVRTETQAKAQPMLG